MLRCISTLTLMTRREMLTLSTLFSAGCLAGSISPLLGAERSASRKKILFFTKSSGFEHSVIKRPADEPSFAEKILAEIGPRSGLDFTFSKDGGLFTREYLEGFDAIFFYTTGDLGMAGTDGQPPISAEGKKALLDAVSAGKGFVGCHSASDTYHSGEGGGRDSKDISSRYRNYGKEADSYIRMLGGEFIKHGAQQKTKLRLIDAAFPGAKALGNSEVHEEWYSLKEFAPDLHVILVQETAGMAGPVYQRPAYPSTWARRHGHGRVFYTSLGHREDIWTSPKFQELLIGGLSWASGALPAEIPQNLESAAPGCAEIPPQDPVNPVKKN